MKNKMKLPRIGHILLFSLAEEQVSNLEPILNAHGFKETSIESKIMLDGFKAQFDLSSIFVKLGGVFSFKCVEIRRFYWHKDEVGRCLYDNIKCKILKGAIITYCVGMKEDSFVDRFLTKTKVITFFAMSYKYICQLSESVIPAELSKQRHLQFIPMCDLIMERLKC